MTELVVSRHLRFLNTVFLRNRRAILIILNSWFRYIYTAELFPTQVRASAVGICSMIEQFGGIISPLFLLIYESYSWMPGLIFGMTACFAGAISLYLPETHNLGMMMSFDEATVMQSVPASMTIKA